MKESFEIIDRAKNITEDEINKILEDFKNKQHYQTKYEIWNFRDKLLLPCDVEEFFKNLQRCLPNIGIQLTEEQLDKIKNYIQEYKEKYNSFQTRYNSIKEEKQKNCKHTNVVEYMYACYVCNQCGKKF
jgi:hypothetical protein